MNKIYEQILRQYLNQAGQAMKDGRTADAAALYRRAAQETLMQAKGESGSVHQLLVERAKKLIAIADSLPVRRASGAGPADKPVANTVEEPLPPPENLEDLKKELEEYIGLDSIKKQISDMIDFLQVNQLRKARGLPESSLSLHMVFSGNPGTGKTTIARLIGRVYRALGVLEKGQLVEVDRSDLVAGYIGQTAIKTQEVISKAIGGVLFIDGAYAPTANVSGSDFGQEAVNTLLKAMEDHWKDLMVIVAGYTDKMQDFLHSNPGLLSRFNTFLDFPDYTDEELAKIYLMNCKKGGYTLDSSALPVLASMLSRMRASHVPFGNGRDVRNFFQRCIMAQSVRLARSGSGGSKDDLMMLTSEDLENAGV